MSVTELQSIEIALLLEGVYRHYGYDFRAYSPASLRRRVLKAMKDERCETISRLQEKVLHDPACLERFLLTLSISVTAMFRDPHFYAAFRTKVVPMLRTYPSFQIWLAGCATGEEVYSMAILLEEEGLSNRSRIYATDINEAILKRAREGIFPLEMMKEYTANYIQAGGKRSFSDYYTANYGNAIFRPSLAENVVFAQHNLVTDGVFNQFQVIWCRNVTIYFTKPLQDHVHNLLYDSLVPFGVIGLGKQETIRFTPHEQQFAQLVPNEPLYRKIG